MNVTKFMVLFHLSFLLLGTMSLLLITLGIISFDWAAFWTIVIAIFLNVFFEVLWINEARQRTVGKKEVQPVITGVLPMISFVVPTYNEEQNIMRCINSLFKCALNYRDSSEILIVDDGSTDNTFEVAWAHPC